MAINLRQPATVEADVPPVDVAPTPAPLLTAPVLDLNTPPPPPAPVFEPPPPPPPPTPITMPSSYSDPRYEDKVQVVPTDDGGTQYVFPSQEDLPTPLNDTDFADLQRAQNFAPNPNMPSTGDTMQTGSGEGIGTAQNLNLLPQPISSTRAPVDYSSRDSFVRSLFPSAKAIEARTGIPAAALLAIPLNEQGARPAPGNNFYGIKGSNPRTGANTGPVNTWEDYGNGRVNTQDTFRAYASPEESMQDFAQFLHDNPRYGTALQRLQQTGDGEQFVRDVHAAGYATDPQWSNKIISLMQSVKNITGGAAGSTAPQPPGGTHWGVMSAVGGAPVTEPSGGGNAPDVEPLPQSQPESDEEPSPLLTQPTYPQPNEITPAPSPLLQQPQYPTMADLPGAESQVPLRPGAPQPNLEPPGVHILPFPQTPAQAAQALMPPEQDPNEALNPLSPSAIMNAIPAVGNVPGAIAVTGIGPRMALAADVMSNLLAGPNVRSADEVYQIAAQLVRQGVQVAGDDIAQALEKVTQRARGAVEEAAGQLAGTRPRTATAGEGPLGVGGIPFPGGSRSEIPATSGAGDVVKVKGITPEDVARRQAEIDVSVGQRGIQDTLTYWQQQMAARAEANQRIRAQLEAKGITSGNLWDLADPARPPMEMPNDVRQLLGLPTSDQAPPTHDLFQQYHEALARGQKYLAEHPIEESAPSLETPVNEINATPAAGEAPPAPPRRTLADAMRDRQTYQSIKDSPLATPVAEELLQSDQYTPITNAGTLGAAEARVNADAAGALRRVLDTSKPLDVDGIAETMVLTQRAVNDGDIGTIKALYKRLASEGTEAAQKLQLFRKIDDLSPEGSILGLYQQIAKSTKKSGVAKTQARVNQQEADIIRKKAADQIAAVDAIRAKSKQVEKTITGAIEQQRPIKFGDFVRGIRDFLKDETGAVRLMKVADFEMGPEDAARFYQEAQGIKALPLGPERDAAKAALLKKVDDFRAESVKAINGERRAADAAERLRQTQAATAERMRKGLLTPEEEDALLRGQARAETQAARQEVQTERATSRQAETAQRQASAAELKPAERIERDRLRAQQAQAEREARALESLGKQREATIKRAEASLAQQKADAIGKAEQSLAEQPARQEAKATEALNKQREAAPGRNAAALERQKVRETEAERLARESGIQYLSDRDARAAKEQIQRTTEEQVKTALKRQARGNDIEVPDVIAQTMWDRATAIRDMPTDTARQRYDQEIAGRELVSDLTKFAPPERWKAILDLWKIPRSILTTIDNSYVQSQGGLMFLAHPVHGAKTLAATWRALTPDDIRIGIPKTRLGKTIDVGNRLPFSSGEDFARNSDADFMYGQHSKAAIESGLAYDDRNAAGGSGNEFYPSELLKNAPGVKQSERAYNVGSNKDRMDYWRGRVNSWLPDNLKGKSFDSIAELSKATGRSEQDFKDLATWANVLTGKAQINPALKQKLSFLSGPFFAPNFFISHPQVLYYGAKYGLTSSALRPFIARDMAGIATSLGATYALAWGAQKAGLPIKIQTDPDASGFGDIDFGPFHVNPLLGFGPIIHTIGMLVTGEKHNVETNKKYNQPFGDTVLEFVRDHLNIPPSWAWDFKVGTDRQGNPVLTPSPRDPAEAATAARLGLNPTERSGTENAIRRIAQDLLPMFGTDVANAFSAAGAVGLLAAPFQFHGMRINVYNTTRALQNQATAKLFPDIARKSPGNEYAAADVKQKAQVDALPEIQAEFARQEAGSTIGIPDRTRIALTGQQWQTAKERIEKGYTDPAGQHRDGIADILRRGATGKDAADAFKAAKDAYYQAAQTLFNDAYEAAKGKPIVAEVRDLMRDAYQGAQPVVDPVTGDLDYDAQKNQRADILHRAVAAGIDPDYITQKVSPWQVPQVRAFGEQYDKALATLQPYYSLGDLIAKKYGQTRNQIEALPHTDTTYRLYEREMTDAKESMRRQTSNGIEAAGEFLGKFQPLKPEGVPLPKPPLVPLPPRPPVR